MREIFPVKRHFSRDPTGAFLSSAQFDMDNTRRKLNWSLIELQTLTEACKDNLSIIKAKFSPHVTHAKKQAVWHSITERVNSQSNTVRSTKEVKKKWQQLQSSVKKEEASRCQSVKMTGGGLPPPQLEAWKEVVVSTLPKIATDGITDYIETSNINLDVANQSVDAFFDCSDILDTTSDFVAARYTGTPEDVLSEEASNPSCQQIMGNMQEQVLEIEKRKLHAMNRTADANERIANYLQEITVILKKKFQ